jgi:hypothetical protein
MLGPVADGERLSWPPFKSPTSMERLKVRSKDMKSGRLAWLLNCVLELRDSECQASPLGTSVDPIRLLNRSRQLSDRNSRFQGNLLQYMNYCFHLNGFKQALSRQNHRHFVFETSLEMDD